MALQIDQYVLAGELNNIRRNAVMGEIVFAPDLRLIINLVGNLNGPLAGRKFQFWVNRPDAEFVTRDDVPELIQLMGNQQIGKIGEVRLRTLNERLTTNDDSAAPVQFGAPGQPLADSLYLEWFSQNGRVIADLKDVRIEFIEPGYEGVPDDEPSSNSERLESGFGSMAARADDADGQSPFEETGFGDEVDSVDQYGLFDRDLDQQIRQSLDGVDESSGQAGLGQNISDEDESSSRSTNSGIAPQAGSGSRPWDEILPGIDAETKAKFELWDEISHGENEQPVMGLLEKLNLPDPDSLATDEQADPYLSDMIERLAEFNVAIDMCEHMTPLSAYRLLLKELLPEIGVNPNLAATNIVDHLCTWEFCPDCKAEFEGGFDAEFE